MVFPGGGGTDLWNGLHRWEFIGVCFLKAQNPFKVTRAREGWGERGGIFLGAIFGQERNSSELIPMPLSERLERPKKKSPFGLFHSVTLGRSRRGGNERVSPPLLRKFPSIPPCPRIHGARSVLGNLSGICCFFWSLMVGWIRDLLCWTFPHLPKSSWELRWESNHPHSRGRERGSDPASNTHLPHPIKFRNIFPQNRALLGCFEEADPNSRLLPTNLLSLDPEGMFSITTPHKWWLHGKLDLSRHVLFLTEQLPLTLGAGTSSWDIRRGLGHLLPPHSGIYPLESAQQLELVVPRYSLG